MQLSAEQYKALARLEVSNSSEWQEVKNLLRLARESERDGLECETDHGRLHRLQGRASAWGDLLEEIGRSREMARIHAERGQ